MNKAEVKETIIDLLDAYWRFEGCTLNEFREIGQEILGFVDFVEAEFPQLHPRQLWQLTLRDLEELKGQEE